MNTPAAELRAAASKIGAAARNATPGPWTVGGRGEVDEIDHYERPILAEVESCEEDGTPFKETVQVAVVTYHTNGFQYPHAEAKAEAEHIALWNPAVAMLVHDWLIGTAAIDEAGIRQAPSMALALARAINGDPEASATQPVPAVKPEITIQDRGWELAAYDADGTYLGGARRNCIGGSRGQSWYWSVEVRGTEPSEARRKPEARAELLRLAAEAVA